MHAGSSVSQSFTIAPSIGAALADEYTNTVVATASAAAGGQLTLPTQDQSAPHEQALEHVPMTGAPGPGRSGAAPASCGTAGQACQTSSVPLENWHRSAP